MDAMNLDTPLDDLIKSRRGRNSGSNSGGGPSRNRDRGAGGFRKQNNHRSAPYRKNPGDVEGRWTHDLYDGDRPSASGSSSSRSVRMNLGDRVRGLVSDATTSNTSSSTQRRSIMSRLGKQGSGSSSSSPSITVSVANRLGPRTVTASTGGGSGGLGGRSVAAGSAGLTRTVTNDAAVTNLSIRGAAASATIQISNLHPEASAADIETCFAEMGAVQRCVLHTDASGKSKGIAEVTYENRASALEAIAKFHGKVADGRALQVVELTSGSATIAGAASKIAKKSLAAITAASKTMYADHVEASGARVSKVELQPTPVASAASGQPVAARLGPMLGGGGGGSGSGGRKRGGGGGARVERVSRNTSFTVTV